MPVLISLNVVDYAGRTNKRRLRLICLGSELGYPGPVTKDDLA